MLNKEKTYKISTDGLNKMKMDNKQDNINNIVNVSFWSVIIGLGFIGVINIDKIITMVACSGTSKLVKYIIR